MEEFTESQGELRVMTAHELGTISAAAVEPLIVALKNKDAEAREYALIALVMTRSKRAIEPLKDLLHDNDAHVRELAARVLAAIKDGKNFTPLPAK